MGTANYDAPLTVQGKSGAEALPVTTPTGASASMVQGTAAAAAAPVGNPVQVGGDDGSVMRTMRLSTSGQVMTIHTNSTIAAGDGISNTHSTAIQVSGSALYYPVTPFVYNRVSGAWDRESGGISASGTFTPAAASHTAGDVNGAAATFDLNAAPSSVIEICSASLMIESATIETTAWTLHLYSVTPPSALADDAVFDIPSGDRASYLGFISLAQVVDYGSTLYIESHNIGKRVQLAASGDLFGYLVNGTTLTPGAVAHTVKLICRPA